MIILGRLKQYARLTQSDIADLTVEQLIKEINVKAKAANSRVRRLKKSGDINNPIIKDEIRNLAYSPYGTASGYFSNANRNGDINELREQYLKIRDFLSSPSTKPQLREYENEYARRVGLAPDKVPQLFNILSQLNKLGYYISTLYEMTQIVEHQLNSGYNDEATIQRVSEAIDSFGLNVSRETQDFNSTNGTFDII